MHADDALRPFRRRRDLGNGQRGGVCREDRVGLRDAIELREQLALELELLEHRFDDEIAVREVGEIGGQRQASRCSVAVRLGEPALLDAPGQVPLDGAAAALRQLVAHFPADRVEPRLDADLRYPRPHRAEADDADFSDRH